jgi:hypothetical protein
MFEEYQRSFSPEILAWCETMATQLTKGISPDWRRKGTWMEAWNGPRRIAFAPHIFGLSIYFQSPEPIHVYREIGGQCSTGKVTIRLKAGVPADVARIRAVLIQYFSGT